MKPLSPAFYPVALYFIVEPLSPIFYAGPPDAKTVDGVLITINDWNQLGRKLGIPSHKLDEIDCDYCGTIRKRSAMIDLWLQYDVDCSWEKLSTALEEMGYKVLAKQIRDKYC